MHNEEMWDILVSNVKVRQCLEVRRKRQDIGYALRPRIREETANGSDIIQTGQRWCLLLVAAVLGPSTDFEDLGLCGCPRIGRRLRFVIV